MNFSGKQTFSSSNLGMARSLLSNRFTLSPLRTFREPLNLSSRRQGCPTPPTRTLPAPPFSYLFTIRKAIRLMRFCGFNGE